MRLKENLIPAVVAAEKQNRSFAVNFGGVDYPRLILTSFFTVCFSHDLLKTRNSKCQKLLDMVVLILFCVLLDVLFKHK